jgi:hypothetical protein
MMTISRVYMDLNVLIAVVATVMMKNVELMEITLYVKGKLKLDLITILSYFYKSKVSIWNIVTSF